MRTADELSPQEHALVERVLGAYRDGWFPMANDHGVVEWVQPRARAVLPVIPGALHVPKSLAQRVRSGRFEVTSDTAFAETIEACAGPRRIQGELETSTWLHDDIIAVYHLLFRAGHAHSVEAWRTDAEGQRHLVGGLYGLALGGVFCGESMFSRPDLGGTDASKVCLVHLWHHLLRRGFHVLDCQISNDHTDQFGVTEWPRAKYLAAMARHGPAELEWRPFVPVSNDRP